MARKSNTRAAQGSGSIRQRPDGRWEARFTYTDELGQPQRGSVYGKTQKECRQKLTAALKAVDDGTFHKAPKRYTVSEWLEEWLNTYCTTLKPMTVDDYRAKIARYVTPNVGAVQITSLTPIQVQKLCNRLSEGYGDQRALSPKTVKNIHGILHSGLKQAVLCGVLHTNPADNAKLPKVKKPELKPLMDDDINRFLDAIKGNRFEYLYIVDLFTGMRQSEILGLQWDDVDLEAGEITVCRQLQRNRDGSYLFLDETKNGKSRIVAVPAGVVAVLRQQRVKQAAWRLAAGQSWQNQRNLVFTDELGRHLLHGTVYHHMKACVRRIGMGQTRFHDLRHSCAIMALQAGCSVKAVQEQMGHYSSAFTMDVYAAVSNTMREDTKERMEQVFQQVKTL